MFVVMVAACLWTSDGDYACQEIPFGKEHKTLAQCQEAIPPIPDMKMAIQGGLEFKCKPLADN